MSFRLTLTLLLVVLSLAACETDQKRLPTVSEIPFQKQGTLDFLGADGSVLATIDIEIAESDSAQARGLMQRRSLPPNSGMLFVNDTAEMRSFWMKNTPMPLDIIFVGADQKVVNIARRTRPFSEDMIRSEGPAQYVVEVRAGFADRIGLTDSSRIRWRRQ